MKGEFMNRKGLLIRQDRLEVTFNDESTTLDIIYAPYGVWTNTQRLTMDLTADELDALARAVQAAQERLETVEIRRERKDAMERAYTKLAERMNP